MTKSPSRTSAQSLSPINTLLSELRAAHRIIRNALSIMTTEQKCAWAETNGRDGVDGEGATRANEREAVIAHSLDAVPTEDTLGISADYDAAFAAGRKRAACWFAQHGHTLAVFRDLKRAEYAQGLADGKMPVFSAFDAGFAAGVADLIVGMRHG